MQTIMNCFPVPPFSEILDPPVMYTMYGRVCIMYILCVYYVCIHVSLSDTDCPIDETCPDGATCVHAFCCTGQYILELYGSLGEGS